MPVLSSYSCSCLYLFYHIFVFCKPCLMFHSCVLSSYLSMSSPTQGHTTHGAGPISWEIQVATSDRVWATLYVWSNGITTSHLTHKLGYTDEICLAYNMLQSWALPPIFCYFPPFISALSVTRSPLIPSRAARTTTESPDKSPNGSPDHSTVRYHMPLLRSPQHSAASPFNPFWIASL